MMEKNKNLIGISGKKQSGKDTIGNIINYLVSIKNPDFNSTHYKKRFVEDYGKIMLSIESFSGYKKIKFADKLKDIVCILLGCTRKQLEDPAFKEKELGKEWTVYYDETGKISSTPFIGHHGESFRRTMTPRLLLQLLGTQIGRNIIHPDIWVNATMSEYKLQHFRTVKTDGVFSHQEMVYPKWIISDIRFPNEAKAIKDRNGILIRVERFCYDSPEDFLVCNSNPRLRKIGIQDYNINKTLSLEEITDIAKIHGYIPLSEQHESETALDDYKNWDYVIYNNGSISDLVEKVKDILIREEIIK